jgi:glycine cleavage system H protein
MESFKSGDRFRIGLDSIFLQDIKTVLQLDLPNEGDEISQDEVCGLIRGEESKKLLFAPLTGEIVDVNLELHEEPDIIREDPYGIGWLLLLDPADIEEEIQYLLSGDEAVSWWKTELNKRK